MLELIRYTKVDYCFILLNLKKYCGKKYKICWHFRKFQLTENLKVSHSRTLVFTKHPNSLKLSLRKLDHAKIITLKVRFNLANIFVENILNKI